MQVELKGVLKEDTGKARMTLAIEGTVTLDELKTRLGVDPGTPVVACVGEKQLKSAYQFHNTDTITLYPLVTGG